MFDDESRRRAVALVSLYRESGLTIASAESCTGGLVAGLITAIPGSSGVFDRGFVTYSNQAKVECLGVAVALLAAFGAVSREAAAAMAMGALAHSHADVAISVTGVAGPDGGSLEKPVGLVHFGYGPRSGDILSIEKRFGDLGRDGIRAAAIVVALDLLFDVALALRKSHSAS
jgi:nicotinamide-nucleotide amidase